MAGGTPPSLFVRSTQAKPAQINQASFEPKRGASWRRGPRLRAHAVSQPTPVSTPLRIQLSASRDRRQWRRDASSSRGIIDRVTDPTADETRIDRWLCAVRLVKTRPLATRLCEGGHVLVNGSPAKPSTKVRAGDRVEALIADRERVIEIVRPIESRVGAPAAATCYVDHSPPPVVTEAGPGMIRIRGEGRPGKRLRRELDRLRRGDA